MAESIECELCGRHVERHDSYIVTMEVFADPSLPETAHGELAQFDFDVALSQVLAEAETMTADDLQDGVHRRFEYRLCPRCHKRFLANPMGKPRVFKEGRN